MNQSERVLIRSVIAHAETIYIQTGVLTKTASALLSVAQNLVATAGQPERFYCSPVGTEEERASRVIWPGEWVDATGYCRWYFGKWWHTGADLNLNSPHWDADAHSPVYSIAVGEVYAVRQFSGWGNVVCIKHGECLTRYAHVESIQVRQGQSVAMGTMIARIGNAGGRYPWHLHMDAAKLDARMLRYPGDWPGANKSRVLRDYLDPLKFLRARV